MEPLNKDALCIGIRSTVPCREAIYIKNIIICTEVVNTSEGHLPEVLLIIQLFMKIPDIHNFNIIFQLLSERESLLSIVDDLKQITEAAKRERVLAIDEKDLMLRE